MITLIRPLLFSNILSCFFQAALETKHKMGPAADRIYLIHFNDVYDIESGDKVSFLEFFLKYVIESNPYTVGQKKRKVQARNICEIRPGIFKIIFWHTVCLRYIYDISV